MSGLTRLPALPAPLVGVLPIYDFDAVQANGSSAGTILFTLSYNRASVKLKRTQTWIPTRVIRLSVPREALLDLAK